MLTRLCLDLMEVEGLEETVVVGLMAAASLVGEKVDYVAAVAI